MNSGAFGENFPYSNFHDLNMDWIIKIAKDFLDQYTNIQNVITTGLEDLDDKAEELEGLLQAWSDTHSQDIAQQLANSLVSLNQWYTEHLAEFNQALTDNMNTFDAHAEQKATQTIASIPSDYTALFNQVQKIDIIANNAEGIENALVNVGTPFTPVENGYSVLRRDGTIVEAQYSNRIVTDPIPVTVGDVFIFNIPPYDLNNASSYVH